MLLSTGPLFIFDIETTGVDPETDRIIELGAAWFRHGEPVDTRRMLVNPEQSIPQGASQVHHIYDEHVRSAPAFAEAAPRLMHHVDGGDDGEPPIVVAYNGLDFDARIVNRELTRVGHDQQLDLDTLLDPVVFVRWHHRHHRSRRLDALCRFYGLQLRNAHSATADAVAAGRLLMRMIKAGAIPDDLDTAMAQQRQYADAIRAEWDAWMYWVYRDRVDGETLRMGAGRHIGKALHQIEPDYFTELLLKVDAMPAAVRDLFEAHRPGAPVSPVEGTQTGVALFDEMLALF
ncbi:MAG: exonuclease domain-containing protein [Bradymonadia bacterium]